MNELAIWLVSRKYGWGVLDNLGQRSSVLQGWSGRMARLLGYAGIIVELGVQIDDWHDLCVNGLIQVRQNFIQAVVKFV